MEWLLHGVPALLACASTAVRLAWGLGRGLSRKLLFSATAPSEAFQPVPAFHPLIEILARPRSLGRSAR